MHKCIECGLEINIRAKSGWMREITGWEEVRKGGGANKIANRETTGRVAHPYCLKADFSQEAML